jgi:predicted HAD superfamily Cof-like phosphohydrolase
MSKLKINPEDLLTNINKALNLLHKIEKTENWEELDLEEIKKEADKLKDEVEKKYSDSLDIKK